MTFPIERLLQLRAITPLVSLRQYLSRNPNISAEDAIAALLTIDEGFVASDHEAALELHKILDGKILFKDFTGDLRITLTKIIVALRPQWAKRVYLGRARFLAELEEVDREVHRCFREAGLFVEDPPEDVVFWWDCLNHEVRGIQNFENFMQGRLAEQKSLALEKQRLRDLGIEIEPLWKAIEDNTVGYDILSYRPGEGFPTNMLIEVKSSSRNPPVAIISRNEIEKAKEARDSYVFHVWDMRADRLHEWTFGMIEPHIPQDNGKGEWTYVALPIRAVS